MRRGMRSLFPALLFLLPAAAAAQTPAAPAAPASRVTAPDKVADGVWMARTSQGSNVGWFLVGDEVVAVDTGSDEATGKAVLEKIQETARKPVRYVIVTHAHGDHAGGIGPFVAAGAEVVCHEGAAAALSPIVAASSRTKSGLLAFSERLAFLGGVRRAAAFFLGPAHTADDIVVLLPEEKVLFSGDVALATGAPYMQSSDVDPAGWEKILARLSQLDVVKVVPGHGGLGTQKAITDSLSYVKRVNDVARTLIQENVNEDLIEARLRRPDSGIDAAVITPELLANIRAVMRAQRPKAVPTQAPKPAAGKKK